MQLTVKHILLACAGIITFCIYFNILIRHLPDRPDRPVRPLPDRQGTETNHFQPIAPPPPIRVGFICVGTKTSTLSRMLKTLLHHTSAPVNFSLIGDENCYNFVRDLLVTSHQHTRLEFYEWSQYKSKIDFVPSSHYSGVYGLLKLIVHEILPAAVDRIILLDTDLIFNADILELWKMGDEFNARQAIGIAHELSQWYHDYTKWPADGHGYNSGVMFLDLKKMRQINWTMVWKSELLEPILKLKTSQLGDQDVFNVVAKNQPHLVYRLPCSWNIQWRKDLVRCFNSSEERSHMKILHWNLPDKRIPDDLQSEVAELMNKTKRLGLV